MADVAARGLDTDRVLVVVMDADGRLSNGAIDEVVPLFDDPDVGGVQLAVRIRNRTDNFLLRFQDHQFWTLSSLTQFGRMVTGTVSLGGNGQFTRLRALVGLDGEPWSPSLTEDLDLTIRLALAGWRLTSTPRAAVDQQGVPSVGPLVRQRTRWYQGHMMAGRHLPDVLASPNMSHASAMEVCLYLLVPWIFDLPWSILYHLVLLQVVLAFPAAELLPGEGWALAAQVAIIYLLGFWPALITAGLAKARDPKMSIRRALELGHCFIITNYLSYACAWRALGRMVRGQNGWTKTSRIDESGGEEQGSWTVDAAGVPESLPPVAHVVA
jgi:cellulose synthase/poly-beta-1,6-N-acetylglucosamine synthase-like glycosyltransferase